MSRYKLRVLKALLRKMLENDFTTTAEDDALADAIKLIEAIK